MKIIFVIIGTLVGAGFASGQEIYTFFFSYGIKGIVGILISNCLMGIVIYKTLKIIKEKEINNYKEFLDVIIKRKEKNKYLKIKDIINIIINLFIFMTFFIMIAGFGAYFEQEFKVNSLIGSTILAIFSFAIFMTSTKGVIKVNEIIVPILVIFIFITGIINIKDIELLKLQNYIIQTNYSNWIISSVVYCGYNSILLIPALITLRKYIKGKREISLISIISTIIMIIMSIIIYLLLVRIDVDITKLEMPAVYVVTKTLPILKNIYGIIILASILTTAISLGSSFLLNICQNKKYYPQIASIMCITSVVISKIGFSNLVNSLYPIFGYLGLIQIFKINSIFSQSGIKKKY